MRVLNEVVISLPADNGRIFDYKHAAESGGRMLQISASMFTIEGTLKHPDDRNGLAHSPSKRWHCCIMKNSWPPKWAAGAEFRVGRRARICFSRSSRNNVLHPVYISLHFVYTSMPMFCGKSAMFLSSQDFFSQDPIINLT
jgi:hypothetical protein